MKTLVKEHGLLSVVGQFQNFDIQANGSYGGWYQYGGAGSSFFISKTYFDLAGMSMDEKTLFFEAAGTQTINPPKATGGAAGDNCLIYDIMSSSPLDDLDLANFTAFGNFAQPTSVLTFNETIFARSRLYGITVNEAAIDYMVLLNEEQFGSMSPTASDRVYSYRIAIVLGASDQSMGGLIVYPARHILRATAKEEPDHEYMMRLLRSYQTQQEPDVD